MNIVAVLGLSVCYNGGEAAENGRGRKMTMNIVVADPNEREQVLLSDLLHRLYDPVNVTCFTDPLLALQYAVKHPVDALYTIPAMKRLGGFELGKLLRGMQPDIALYFIADDNQMKTDAMRILADSYLIRPVTAEKLRRAENSEW